MIKLTLPFLPVPKSNRYLRKKGGKVFKPPRVKNWEVRAIWEIKQQYTGEKINKPVSMQVTFILPNRRKRDIDNMLKSLWDVLEKAGVIENDSQIYKITTIKKFIKGQQGTHIIIEEYQEDATV
ncbi:RusA family crossover junction endodeoxyribonuclease [Thermocrinis minervae]|uniref:Crossover junction endodeoxyribonuclease RusA n=1 Tax=Thermocrinis minervae TaxID=381751 RepID=A0A1M6QIL6_9AQUI|nr:RusA family crossover junction endodeoxyribonuclease [Thermocrinis minervae]SHK20072.1 crossover junction endodeoxyribonuclease RusA [Thermocrinis minervae]